MHHVDRKAYIHSLNSTRSATGPCNKRLLDMRYFTLLIAAAITIPLQAQTIITFAVDQPPKFEVDAGDDLAYTPGLTLQAGASGGTNNYSYLWAPPQYLDDPALENPVVQGIMGPTLFTVQVTDLGLGCTLVDDVHVDFTTGMPEVGNEALAVFPNPTDGLVRIQGPVAVQRVQLRSPSGALVLEHQGMTMRETAVDVSSLPAGVYFMTIDLVDGRSHTSKLCTTSAH